MPVQVFCFPGHPNLSVATDPLSVTFHDSSSWVIGISLGYPSLNSDKLTFPRGSESVPEALSRLWKVLNWYFQLPAPSSALIPGKRGSPRGPWKVYFNMDFGEPAFLEAAMASGMISFSSSSPSAPLEIYATHSTFWQVPSEPLLSWADPKPFKIPKPVEYMITNGTRHPTRPRPTATGNLYARWIPSLEQSLTFRLASAEEDSALVHRWMNDPRVAEFWGEDGGGVEKTKSFLQKGLDSQHCYPIIGSWDGQPFGYFEVYWVKEDALGKFVTDCNNWDRGVHCLVGEQKFRGPHRVGVWISSLVHYMFLEDPRTQAVMLEPRVDNEKFINYLTQAGFYKEKEFAFPHKQAALVKLKREAWEGPLS